MTPAEKWRRMTHPVTLEDWGLSMSLDEFKQAPEALKEAQQYIPPQYLLTAQEKTQ